MICSRPPTGENQTVVSPREAHHGYKAVVEDEEEEEVIVVFH